MTGKRLALVADDSRLAQAIQASLEDALGRSVFHCRSEAVVEQLCPLSDRPLLAAFPSSAPAESLLRLVQALSLQRFSPPILLLEGSARTWEETVGAVSPHVADCLSWPGDAATLVRLV